jgi:hypothetical protein
MQQSYTIGLMLDFIRSRIYFTARRSGKSTDQPPMSELRRSVELTAPFSRRLVIYQTSASTLSKKFDPLFPVPTTIPPGARYICTAHFLWALFFLESGPRRIYISFCQTPETGSHRLCRIQFALACCSKNEAPLGTSGKTISYSLQRTRPVDLPRTNSYM